MNLLLTLEQNTLDSQLEKHFGRAPYFVIINTENEQKIFLENNAKNQSSGAGVTMSQIAVDQHVGIVVSGQFGPHAAQILSAAKIKMLLLNDSCQTIDDVLAAYKQGTLLEQKV